MFKKYIFADGLTEVNSFLKFIGAGFILIGISYTFNWIQLSKLAIVSFSFAGLLLVLLDAIEHRLAVLKSKVKKENNKIGFLNYIKRLCICFAVLFLIFVPFLSFNWLDKLSSVLSTAITFLALGSTICILGYKYDKRVFDFYDGIATDVELIAHENESKEKENLELRKQLELLEKSMEKPL